MLQRNVELKLQYVDLVADGADERYDVLLDDYEPQAKTAEVRAVFEELKPPLVALIAELRDREVDDSFLTGDFPVERQEAMAHEVVDLFGHRPDSWRIDPTEHPFASGPGRNDVRITTHYHADNLHSLFSTMHEYGHGLYSHQQPEHLERLPTGGPCSLGIHESQSRLWENLVGRSEPFWQFFYPRLQETYPEQLGGVELDRFLPAINRSKPGLIRIDADEVTYGMHVMLRFELEQDIVEGRVELKDLPEVWNQKMWEYLGVEVPDDTHGVLQDVHWSGGIDRLLLDVPARDGHVGADLGGGAARRARPLRAGRPRRVRGAARVARLAHPQLGRKYTSQEVLERATGSTLQAQPYLDYLRAKYA